MNIHIITGPNGMCRCGEDGKTCSEILSALRDTQERELRDILSTGPEDERTLLEMVREERNLSEELAGKCNDLTEFVEHAAKGYCHCQMSGPDVEHNRHRASCMVGRAQKHLGIKMEEIE